VNPLVLALLMAGALLGTGVAVTVSSAVGRRPDLVALLAALDERTSPVPAESGSVWLDLLRRRSGRVPDEDLRLLGWSRDRFLVSRALAAARYAAVGPVLAAVTVVTGSGFGFVVPGAFTVIGALVGWTGVRRRVEQRADAARNELRFTLVSYLQQVSLLRQGGAGVATALSVPAQVLGDGWAMRRLADELALAERGGLMPWEGLRRFGHQVGVRELDDLSAIAASAGQDGGAVIDTLLARAESLRDELLADEHAEAHRASGQMSTPGALQVFLISAWVLYPAGVALLSL
jgi:tight adherence protein C